MRVRLDAKRMIFTSVGNFGSLPETLVIVKLPRRFQQFDFGAPTKGNKSIFDAAKHKNPVPQIKKELTLAYAAHAFL